ncbi:hypothetical protein IMZ48_02700, partial [Candidatus Bathyarchaeota archaeon]|nr:hypothetical protein [Candidatus Bathyarchaeota archaeon]
MPVLMAATPPALGVFTAILDAVVFCNQDESLWPMSEHCSGVSTKLLQQRHPEIYPDEDEEAANIDIDEHDHDDHLRDPLHDHHHEQPGDE